jgi:hypothetical protein
MAGVMNLVQMSRSDRDFLSIPPTAHPGKF